ncbi:hypothetical protein GOHSU_14_00180 [Gordonia hirsuta DSM 44140 = NBRC 16056]|uniref:DUF3093 domain-containing protein n=1 Tax=Gordonia hirsuta DSM 44140 = NBRC 16056 TaxID=1121927 RepID=L7L7X0_9ACTN|nr:hypothetical protein [Gordonia hirsuta]GAC56851.1 hypothetical protein GOHSU_14_00180 [Gordonia hirsuta DSM 44140 = NBRC 16056]
MSRRPDPDANDPAPTEAADGPAAESGAQDSAGQAAAPAQETTEETAAGRVLFDEPGGSTAVIWIGPLMIVAVLILEIVGQGRIHWEILTIFAVILVGFGMLQFAAARRHVSVVLTETSLRQGAETVELADIAEIYPENRTHEHQKWESARALGELPAVPRRRKGVGVRFTNGRLAQAWARDVDRFRSELTDAHLAVKMGLTGEPGTPKRR